MELFIGAFIGAITFTASVIAYGKLSGRFGSKAISFKGSICSICCWPSPWSASA